MIRLQAGTDHLSIDPDAGGRIIDLVLAGRPRLVGAPREDGHQPRPEDHFQWGCFVMAPWAGRIRGATFPWRDRTAHVAARLHGHALHGLAMDRSWEVATATDRRAQLSCRLDDAPWPFTGARVDHDLSLAPGRLDLGLRVTAGPHPMPAWVGWHPCFRRPRSGDVTLAVDAPATLVVDHDTVPTGDLAVVEGPTDLRSGPRLGGRRLDDTWVDVTWPVVVSWPDLELVMEADGADTVVVFTPAHEFCVEPQSGWPDAIHLADRHGTGRVGLASLEPGATTTATTTWRWQAPGRR